MIRTDAERDLLDLLDDVCAGETELDSLQLLEIRVRAADAGFRLPLDGPLSMRSLRTLRDRVRQSTDATSFGSAN